jgi:hypothetical protein
MASAARCRWLRHDACAQRRWLSHPVLIDIRKFPLRQTHRGLLGGSVRASSSTCPSRRNLARRVPDPDGDQRVRTRQGAQGAPALGPMTLCSDVVRSRRTLQCAWDATSACRAGILDQSSGALRSRRCQPHREEKNRAGGRPPKRSLIGCRWASRLTEYDRRLRSPSSPSVCCGASDELCQ